MIRHKLSSFQEERNNKISYIVYMEGHKNSKGESSPWVIKDHKNGKILSSHSSKQKAKKHLQQMHIFASFDPQKEQEIVVWMRLQQKGLDKQQITDFVKDKFHVDDLDAERLFHIAYPDGVSLEQKKILNDVDTIILSFGQDVPHTLITDILAVSPHRESIAKIARKYEIQDETSLLNLSLLLDKLFE